MDSEMQPTRSLQVTLAGVGVLVESEEIAQQYYSTYMQRLMAVVRRNLADRFQSRVDAEDVVQSVFRTWVRRSGEGDFNLANEDELWSLLCVIALNKVRKAVLRHSAQKRDVSKTLANDEVVKAIPEPSVTDAVEFVELLELVQERLDAPARRTLEMKLEGHSDKEVATELGLSTRTISRHKVQIEEILTELISQGETP